MTKSGKQAERSTVSTLPLSPRLQAIVAVLLEAIDERFRVLEDLSSEDHHVRSCTTCQGTGVALIPIINVSDDEGEDDIEVQEPTLIKEGGMGGPSAMSGLGIVPVAGDMTVGVTDAAPSPATVVPDENDEDIGAGVNLPPVSPPLAGLNPMPMGTPAPPPEDSLHAGPGAARYYAVTRGRRLGVYAGWENTTAYVTSVGGACFSKFTNVYEAYHAYVVAYELGHVMYL